MAKLQRRAVLALAIAAPALATRAFAADFPTRPMRLIVPYAPGGGADAVARVVARKVGESLGQTMVVENKGPIRNFTETGLTEFSLALRELRQLTANLNIIATKLERDPANFVFSGKQGYTPK